jgi:hypothetical protein
LFPRNITGYYSLKIVLVGTNFVVINTEISFASSIVGHFGDTEINFSDIENRARYLKKVFKNRYPVLHEAIVADDKIIFRDRQIMTHRKTELVLVTEVTGVEL